MKVNGNSDRLGCSQADQARLIATGRAAVRLSIVERMAHDAASHTSLLVRDLAEAAALDGEGFAMLRAAAREMRKALIDLEFIARVEAIDADRSNHILKDPAHE